jgi:hypothetical protein
MALQLSCTMYWSAKENMTTNRLTSKTFAGQNDQPAKHWLITISSIQ